jgi:DNA-binding MarR family transcriptional regulator
MDTMTEQILAQLRKTNENIDATTEMVAQKTEEIKDAIDESSIHQEELNETPAPLKAPSDRESPNRSESYDNIGDVTAEDTSIDSTGGTAPRITPMDLSPNERKVLRAAGRMSARTMTGLAQDSGISRARIGEVVDQLISKALLRRTISANTNGLRIMLTAEGASLLDSMTLNLPTADISTPTEKQ